MEELEMKKTLKSNSLSMLIGVLLGAALFGGGTVLASSGVMATPSTQSIYVDGQRVNMTAYSIGGNNYVKLRDVGEAVDFAVSYDAATKSVQIDSDAPYVAESKAPAATTAPTKPATSSAPAGAISVPQTDEAPFVPKEGDVILCDDGSTYTITDMSHYRNHASPGALPTATCDWSQFPEVELPKAETRHFKDEHGDDLFIRNLYETRRMQYTLYNAIGANSETWQDGKLLLRSDGVPYARVQLSITSSSTEDFWPWDANQIINDFNSCPWGLFKFEAWDYYSNGIFQHTRYVTDDSQAFD